VHALEPGLLWEGHLAAMELMLVPSNGKSPANFLLTLSITQKNQNGSFSKWGKPILNCQFPY
jgi:hypothetical protein